MTVRAPTAGYPGTPLAKKLGVAIRPKPGPDAALWVSWT